MKKVWLLMGLFLLTACTAAPAQLVDVHEAPPVAAEKEQETMDLATSTPEIDLPDLGKAPELENEVWLNTDQPLRLEQLRGKVVLLDMWTFGCINCQHVVPSLREWYGKYGDQGLVVIGNHFPEFNHERDLDNLKAAVERLEIAYPVAQDNDGKTWREYENHYWPTLYLIDKRGHIRYKHVGEGAYQETEDAIQALLSETGS